MARYWCERCGEESNTLSEPHLCKDVAKRLTRRVKQREAVRDILSESICVRGDWNELGALAEAIVAKLAQMGVDD